MYNRTPIFPQVRDKMTVGLGVIRANLGTRAGHLTKRHTICRSNGTHYENFVLVILRRAGALAVYRDSFHLKFYLSHLTMAKFSLRKSGQAKSDVILSLNCILLKILLMFGGDTNPNSIIHSVVRVYSCG